MQATTTDGARIAGPDEREAIERLVNRVLGRSGPTEVAREYPTVFGPAGGAGHAVAGPPGEPWSHAAFLVGTARFNGLELPLARIGSVATDPARRGQGLGGDVVREAELEAVRRGAELALLWGDLEFYGPLGYVEAGTEHDFIVRAPWTPVGPAGLHPMPYRPDLLPALAAVQARERCRVDRSPEELARLLEIPHTGTLVGLRDGRLSAYAITGKGSDLSGFVHELGGQAEDAATLAGALASNVTGGGVVMVGPDRTDLQGLFRDAGATESVGILGLVKVLHPAAFFARVGRHLQAGGVTAAFRVEGDEVEARGSRGTVRRPLQWWVPVLLSRRGAVDAFADLEAATGPLGGLLPVPFYVPGLDSI